MRNWSSNDQAYEPVMEKAVYHYAFDQVMAVNYFRRSSEKKDFKSVGGMFVMNPHRWNTLATKIILIRPQEKHHTN